MPFIEPSEASRLDDHERLELVRANVSVPNELSAAVALAAGDSDAPLTALVNLVGGFESGPRTHEADADAIDRQLDLNVKTTYAVLREGLPHLVAHGRGSVVSMSSGAALKPFPAAPPTARPRLPSSPSRSRSRSSTKPITSGRMPCCPA